MNKYVQPDPQDADEAIIENAKIDEQRVLWAEFMSELPSDDLTEDPELWQYWRSQRQAKAHSAHNVISKKIAKVFNVGGKKLLKQQSLKYLIRDGIPPELRGKVWYATSGAHDLKKEQEAKGENFRYDHIVENEIGGLSGEVAEEIEKDLNRTRTLPTPEGLPEELLAKYDAMNELGIASLRRVLKAYAVRNPDIGYCQSMNFVAMMLLFHMNEEQSFWTLASLIEVILPQDYYSKNLMGVRMDQGVFQRCVEEHAPKLHEHLDEIGVVLDPITINWFLSIFVGVLPIYGACRVWDCLLFEGDVILFRTGLVLLNLRKRDLMSATDAHGCHTVLKCSAPEQGTVLHTYNLPKPPIKKVHRKRDILVGSGLAGEQGTEMKETFKSSIKSEEVEDDDEDEDGCYTSLQIGYNANITEGIEDGRSSREQVVSRGRDTGDSNAHGQMTVSSVSYMMSQTFKHRNYLARERVEALRAEIWEDLKKEQDMSQQWRMSSVDDQNGGSPWEDRASIIAFSLGASSSIKGGTLPEEFMKTMDIIDKDRTPEQLSPATSLDRRNLAMSSWKASTASDADPVFLAAARNDSSFAEAGDPLRSSLSPDRVSNSSASSPSRKDKVLGSEILDASDSENSTVPDITASQAAMDNDMSFISDKTEGAKSPGSPGTDDEVADDTGDDNGSNSADGKKRTSSSKRGSWTGVWKSLGDWVGGLGAKGTETDRVSGKAKAKKKVEDDL